jgi:hypothetical protein
MTYRTEERHHQTPQETRKATSHTITRQTEHQYQHDGTQQPQHKTTTAKGQ